MEHPLERDWTVTYWGLVVAEGEGKEKERRMDNERMWGDLSPGR